MHRITLVPRKSAANAAEFRVNQALNTGISGAFRLPELISERHDAAFPGAGGSSVRKSGVVAQRVPPPTAAG